MRKTDKRQRATIVSFRIDDKEKQFLEKAAKKAKLSVSDLLRVAFTELRAQKTEEGAGCSVDNLVQEVWPRPGVNFYCYGSYLSGDLSELRQENPVVAAGEGE